MASTAGSCRRMRACCCCAAWRSGWGWRARLAACLRDRRDPDRIEHTVEEMLRLRMFAIAAGYEDADDCDSLRHDPVFKMAVGRLPESGEPLCSQPTMSRLENAPRRSSSPG